MSCKKSRGTTHFQICYLAEKLSPKGIRFLLFLSSEIITINSLSLKRLMSYLRRNLIGTLVFSGWRKNSITFEAFTASLVYIIWTTDLSLKRFA